jgi:hypothetical protein
MAAKRRPSSVAVLQRVDKEHKIISSCFSSSSLGAAKCNEDGSFPESINHG